MANKRIKKKRALTKHQKELRAIYSRERKNAVARMRRLESEGYVFEYEIRSLSPDFNPTKRDIERVKNLRGEALTQTGYEISGEGEIISKPTAKGIKQLQKLSESKIPEVVKRAHEPTPYPDRPSTSEGETLEPEGPEDEESETEELPGTSRADHPPVWADYVLMRTLGMGARYAQYTHPDYQEVAARGQELLNTLRDAINKFGSDRVAKILYDLMQETGDLFDEKVFYNGQAFSSAMEKLYNAFAEAGIVDEQTRQREVEKWEDAREQLQNHEDYDT